MLFVECAFLLFVSITYLPVLNVFGSNADNFFSFSAKDPDGNVINFNKYEKTVVLVTNVASYCGYTSSHYRDYRKLKEKYGNWLHILAFPCNQFGQQEPEDSKTIRAKLTQDYHINFEIFDKIEVLGPNTPDFWKYLTENFEGAKWNFHKYLVDSHGQVVGGWGPDVGMDLIESKIDEAVAEARLRDEL